MMHSLFMLIIFLCFSYVTSGAESSVSVINKDYWYGKPQTSHVSPDVWGQNGTKEEIHLYFINPWTFNSSSFKTPVPFGMKNITQMLLKRKDRGNGGNTFDLKVMDTNGMDDGKVNDGKSQIKQPWKGKIWKDDNLDNMQLYFWGQLEKSSQSDYFDYARPSVFALLSVYGGTMVSFNSQGSLLGQLSLFLSFSPHLHHPRNAEFQPQGLKSG